MTIRISESIVQHGYGRDRWKRLAGLTKADKEFILAGGVLAFQAGRLSGGNHGTCWRVVREKNGYFNPYVPDEETLHCIDLAEEMIKRTGKNDVPVHCGYVQIKGGRS